MSSILGFGGNIFDSVATYDRYVEYRLVDQTLNTWNYEPIYAARWPEPVEVAPNPQALYAIPPFRAKLVTPAEIIGGNGIGGNGVGGNTTTGITAETTPEVLADVPEPGYGILLALLALVMWARLLRNSGYLRHLARADNKGK